MMGFLPWVGDHYRHGAFFGLRVLIVGESHYGDDAETATQYVVRQAIEGKDTRFLGAVGAACAGRDTYKANRARFWHSVAFMNFVQQSVGTQTEPPTEKMFRDGVEPFKRSVERLEPDRIVVFSKAAWDTMPPFVEGTWKPFDDGEPNWAGCYALPRGGYATAMCAYHPNTRGWSANKWHGIIAKFLSHTPGG